MKRYRVAAVPRVIEAASPDAAIEEYLHWLARTMLVNEDDLVIRVSDEDDPDAAPLHYLGSEPVQLAGQPREVRIPARLLDHIEASTAYQSYARTRQALPLDVPLFRALARTPRRPDGSIAIQVDRVLRPSLAWWAHDLIGAKADELDRRANVRSARAVLRALEKIR